LFCRLALEGLGDVAGRRVLIGTDVAEEVILLGVVILRKEAVVVFSSGTLEPIRLGL